MEGWRGRTAYETFIVGAVSEAFDAVPDCAAYCLLCSYLVSYTLCMINCGWETRTPMEKAPPKSDNATHGHGSRE